MAPHGVFRCQGDDRWLALAVPDDETWQRFCRAIDKPQLAVDPRWASAKSRKDQEDELEAVVEGWTQAHSPESAQATLIAAGVPAHVVAAASDLDTDAQLHHRNHLIEVQHPELGGLWIENARFRLSRTPGELTSAAPIIGEHTEYVLSQLLGMSDSEIADLAETGVLA